LREKRTMRATLKVFAGPRSRAVTGNTYVGPADRRLDVRAAGVVRTPSGKPGKTRASFHVASSDPKKRPGVTTVKRTGPAAR